MFSIKKFYNTDVAEGGGADTEVAEQQQSETKPSLASMMAKGGVKVAENTIDKPIDNTTKSSEVKEETKVDVKKDEKPVETTTSQTDNVEKGNLETPTKKEEVKEEAAKPQIEEKQQPQLSFQEVLKQQPKTEVLKALGYDDKMVKVLNQLEGFDKVDFFSNLLNEWKTKGDLSGYLKELSTDYKKMPSEEVMRHQLREDYPTASEAQLNALYKNKIVKAYNLDSEDAEEVEEGKLLLDAEADKSRARMIEKQQTKLFPTPSEANTVSEQDEQERIAEQQQEKELEMYKSKMESDPYSKGVFDNKQVVIGDFKYNIDPESIKNVLYDSSKWAETQFEITRNPDGTIKTAIPKVENQILTAAFAQNPQKFLDDYAKHYLSLGGKKVNDVIENAKESKSETTANTKSQPKTLAEAMAKSGTKTDGSFQ